MELLLCNEFQAIILYCVLLHRGYTWKRLCLYFPEQKNVIKGWLDTFGTPSNLLSIFLEKKRKYFSSETDCLSIVYTARFWCDFKAVSTCLIWCLILRKFTRGLTGALIVKYDYGAIGKRISSSSTIIQRNFCSIGLHWLDEQQTKA